MSTLDQLSVAVGEALRDAETHGAAVAAHVLRCQLPELFRLARLAGRPHPITSPQEPDHDPPA